MCAIRSPAGRHPITPRGLSGRKHIDAGRNSNVSHVDPWRNHPGIFQRQRSRPAERVTTQFACAFQHVVIIEESHGYSQIINNVDAPCINRLAREGECLTNSFGVSQRVANALVDLAGELEERSHIAFQQRRAVIIVDIRQHLPKHAREKQLAPFLIGRSREARQRLTRFLLKVYRSRPVGCFPSRYRSNQCGPQLWQSTHCDASSQSISTKPLPPY